MNTFSFMNALGPARRMPPRLGPLEEMPPGLEPSPVPDVPFGAPSYGSGLGLPPTAAPPAPEAPDDPSLRVRFMDALGRAIGNASRLGGYGRQPLVFHRNE